MDQQHQTQQGPDPSILLAHTMPNYKEGRSHIKNVVETAVSGGLLGGVVHRGNRQLLSLFPSWMGGPIHNGSTIKPKP